MSALEYADLLNQFNSADSRYMSGKAIYLQMIGDATRKSDSSIIAEAIKRFAYCDQLWANADEKAHHDWLNFWQGSNWTEVPPNRLFGAYWVGDCCV